jgi:hypothetical protein
MKSSATRGLERLLIVERDRRTECADKPGRHRALVTTGAGVDRSNQGCRYFFIVANALFLVAGPTALAPRRPEVGRA